MIKLNFIVILIVLATIPKSWSSDEIYTIENVQGSWWSSCEEPSVEFYIDGDNYSGDFMGTYKIEVKDNVLTFERGLIDGHSINVTGIPLSFRIVLADTERLVLESIYKEIGIEKWILYACN